MQPINEEKVEAPEVVIDQDKLNNFYTGIIARAAQSDKREDLEAYIKKHKVGFRTIVDGNSSYFTITDKNNKILGQKNTRLFIKVPGEEKQGSE